MIRSSLIMIILHLFLTIRLYIKREFLSSFFAYVPHRKFSMPVKFAIDFFIFCVIMKNVRAGVMESADLTDSKSVAFTGVRVRPPPPAP